MRIKELNIKIETGSKSYSLFAIIDDHGHTVIQVRDEKLAKELLQLLA